MKKRLVLIGAGHAHLHVLKSLTMLAPQPFDGVEITLISPFARQVYSAMLPGWIAGHYDISQCVIPLLPLAGRADALFRQTAATNINFARSMIHCADGQEIPFDLLSIDSESVTELSIVSGLAQHAIPLRPIESFIESHAKLADDILTRHKRGERTRVAFVGAGTAGAELALAIQHRFFDFDLGVTLISAASTLPGSVGPRLARIMRARGIVVLAGQAVTNVTRDGVQLASGAMVEADVVIAATSTAVAKWPCESGLKTDAGGFILVNDQLQSISHANVFAAGDCSLIENHARPEFDSYAAKAGPLLNENLRRALRGDSLQRHVSKARSMYLISAGGKYAIGSWGNFSWEGGWVWLLKDMIDRGFIGRYAVDDARGK